MLCSKSPLNLRLSSISFRYFIAGLPRFKKYLARLFYVWLISIVYKVIQWVINKINDFPPNYGSQVNLPATQPIS